jgi:hypothetical protein
MTPTLGQHLALMIVVKALLAASRDKPAIIDAIKRVAGAGLQHADETLQAEIDASLINWINSI